MEPFWTHLKPGRPGVTESDVTVMQFGAKPCQNLTKDPVKSGSDPLGFNQGCHDVEAFPRDAPKIHTVQFDVATPNIHSAHTYKCGSYSSCFLSDAKKDGSNSRELPFLQACINQLQRCSIATCILKQMMKGAQKGGQTANHK